MLQHFIEQFFNILYWTGDLNFGNICIKRYGIPWTKSFNESSYKLTALVNTKLQFASEKHQNKSVRRCYTAFPFSVHMLISVHISRHGCPQPFSTHGCRKPYILIYFQSEILIPTFRKFIFNNVLLHESYTCPNQWRS